MRVFLRGLFLVLLATPAVAAGPSFQQLTKSDFEDVIKDFTSVTSHTSVSPASSLGAVFGWELGVIAGAAQTPKIKDLSNSADPGSDVSMLPEAGILLAMSFPLGFTAEALVMPKVEISGVKAGNTSLAAKWTITDVFPIVPFDMAVKLNVSKASTDFTGTIITPNDTTFNYDGLQTGFAVEASKKLTIFEPYINFGLINTKGKLKANQAGLFDPLYTSSNSSTEKLSGMQFMVGANFNILIMKLGLEVGKVTGNTKAAAKFSFYF